jgi:hypothetical protein
MPFSFGFWQMELSLSFKIKNGVGSSLLAVIAGNWYFVSVLISGLYGETMTARLSAAAQSWPAVP